MKLSQAMSKGALITATMGLGNCGLYEDNFTTRGQLFKKVNGSYGINPQCEYEALLNSQIDEALKPDFVVLDYYQVYDRSCYLTDVEKDGNGFILKPPQGEMSCRHRQSADGLRLKAIAAFSVRVEPINKNTVKFQETGKAPVTVYRCGSKVN